LPRPGTRSKFEFSIGRDSSGVDYGGFAASVTLRRGNGGVTVSGGYDQDNWASGGTSGLYFAQVICQQIGTNNAGFDCYGGDVRTGSQLIYAPIGETDWVMTTSISGGLVDGVHHYGIGGRQVERAISTVLVSQPQIVSFTPSGIWYPGSVYTIRLNGVAYSYTSVPGDTSATLAQGIAAAIQSPSFIANTGGYNNLSVIVQGAAPAVPFEYATEVSAYPITITPEVVQPPQ
jgi:hypothetical protein